MSKKIFTACLGTETNTFASIPTGHQLFEETCLFRKGSYGKDFPMFGAPLAVWRQRSEAKGWQVVESLCAFAQPAGKTVKKVYEAFRDEIMADLEAAMPVDAEGYELGHFGFSAVLRDYARLGRLLAHDGAWNGQQVIPARWMIEATTVRPEDAYLLPGKAMRDFGYGYLFWLLPGNRRQFALVGAFGQRIIVDPLSKLVMVQTALDETDGASWKLWRTLVAQLG